MGGFLFSLDVRQGLSNYDSKPKDNKRKEPVILNTYTELTG